jgi:hypothetical protein
MPIRIIFNVSSMPTGRIMSGIQASIGTCANARKLGPNRVCRRNDRPMAPPKDEARCGTCPETRGDAAQADQGGILQFSATDEFKQRSQYHAGRGQDLIRQPAIPCRQTPANEAESLARLIGGDTPRLDTI